MLISSLGGLLTMTRGTLLRVGLVFHRRNLITLNFGFLLVRKKKPFHPMVIAVVDMWYILESEFGVPHEHPNHAKLCFLFSWGKNANNSSSAQSYVLHLSRSSSSFSIIKLLNCYFD